MERRDAIRRPVESVLVTEMLSGRTGRAALREIEPARRRRRLVGIGRTVRRLREFGFAHRDLKLDNWHFPEADDTPRLLDLDGLRRREASDTMLGSHLARFDRDLVSIGAGRTDRLRVVVAALGPADRDRLRTVLDAMERRADREARP
jgi:tRNA A-37 threonylcarbamoyl transferase component Bud32